MKRLFSQFAFLILALFLSVTVSLADVGDWKTFTNAKNIRQMSLIDSVIWCATNGGVLRFNRLTNSFFTYTNTEGLASIDVVAIEPDKNGNIWAGMADGELNILNVSSNSWETYSYFRDLVIHDFLAYGDSVFVASSSGVSVMKLDNSGRWEVKETYKSGNTEHVLITPREIWLATHNGVWKAELGFPNLIAPSAWTIFGTAHGLPTNEALSLLEYDSGIAVGTENGILFYDGLSWSPVELTGRKIYALALWQDSLVATTDNGIYLRDMTGIWTRMESISGTVRNVQVDSDNNLWIDKSNQGLAQYKVDSNQWMLFEPGGPGDNKFTALILDDRGFLWTASSSGGISRFDGLSWLNFSQSNKLLSSNDYRDLAIDSKNRIWAASWGGGVAVFEYTENDSILITEIKSDEGYLSGIQSDADFVVITELVPDASGNMWILNREAGNKKVLAVVSPENEWQYFTSADGIGSVLVEALEIDNVGRKWIGTENRGIKVLDDNDTPFDKNDDDLRQGLTAEDGLESVFIKSLAFDDDGVMWIGTPGGLHTWFNGNVRFESSVINDDINCIAVDVRNNKWIGTSGGLSFLEADGFTWQHYSTSDSPLSSDNVSCFAFDEETGEVYIGTTNGLSRFETAFTRPEKDLSFVTGHPNPFILSNPGVRFYIENLAENSTIRIFTPEGVLVKHIPKQSILGSRISWDGTNDRGQRVASGIYVYLVSTEDGLSKVGKVAVINP